MPMILGLASSHAPSMFCPPEKWPEVHRGLTRGLPQPPQLAEETPEVIEDYVRRVQQGFRTLRERIEAAEPDALFIVGDDQNEVFSKAFVPAVAIYTGQKASGTTSIRWIGQQPSENHVAINGHPGIAGIAVEGLMERGFDPAVIEELKPLARPEGGLGHAFMRIARAIGAHETGLPIVPVFVNAGHDPMPSGARCYQLGRALHDVFANRPERVAIYGSGGLSHDPLGPRAGWVDEPLDRWVLERISRGEGDQLQSLFTFDSDTLRGGTGEIRNWIAVAGAFAGTPATVVDYIPARHAVTGLAFAYWKNGTN